jgi:ankyrin repeat protein
MVRLLLKSGADPKVKDQYSLTALVYAMQAKRSDIVSLLKDAGGNY